MQTAKACTVRGYTTIFGRVTAAGGKKPAITISRNGELLRATAAPELVKEAARKLYEDITLHGIAGWNSEDWTINSFKAEGIGKYARKPYAEALGELAAAAGSDAWAQKDVTAAVTDLRRGNIK